MKRTKKNSFFQFFDEKRKINFHFGFRWFDELVREIRWERRNFLRRTIRLVLVRASFVFLLRPKELRRENENDFSRRNETNKNRFTWRRKIRSTRKRRSQNFVIRWKFSFVDRNISSEFGFFVFRFFFAFDRIRFCFVIRFEQFRPVFGFELTFRNVFDRSISHTRANRTVTIGHRWFF